MTRFISHQDILFDPDGGRITRRPRLRDTIQGQDDDPARDARLDANQHGRQSRMPGWPYLTWPHAIVVCSGLIRMRPKWPPHG